MPDYVPSLLLQVVMLYELDGWEGGEKYARDNGRSVGVCRELLNEYVLANSTAAGPLVHEQQKSKYHRPKAANR